MDISGALIDCLRKAKRVMVLTGQGIAADNAIPHFDADMTAFLASFKCATRHGAAEQAFRKDPALVWRWYEAKRRALLNIQPSQTHLAIAALQKHIPRLTVATENFDDLHERAGNQKVLHFYGNLLRPKCFDCGRTYRLLPPLPLENEPEPPHCPYCNGLVRPGFWFPEIFPSKHLLRAEKAAQACEIMLMIGIRHFALPERLLVSMAHKAGACIINIQPDAAALGYCHEHQRYAPTILPGNPDIIMPELLRVAFGKA